MAAHRSVRRRIFVALALLLAAGCESGTTAPDALDVPVIQAAKPTSNGGSKDAGPTVKEVNPSSAPQDTTLDLEVLGSNFEAGSKVSFELAGEFTGNIKTNGVTFVNPRKLVANITVALNADVASYDVIVTFRGRKGIGTELLDIFVKGNKPTEPVLVETTFPETFNGDVFNGILHDTIGSSYVGGACGVISDVKADIAPGVDFFDFRPVDPALKGKALKELDKNCEAFPRFFTFDINDTTWVHDPIHPDHSYDRPLGDLVAEGSALDPSGLTNGINVSLRVPDVANGTSVGGAFNTGYCQLPGPPFLFNSSREPESDDLVVTRMAFGKFQVSTQPYPNNVGHCVHTVNGEEKVLLLHMDLAYDVTPLG